MINKYWEKPIIIIKGRKFVTKRGDRYDIKKVIVIKQK